MVIKLGSLFDGIGGFPLAGVKFGFVPVWASEIEPWPIKVTEKHFPNMKHLGDITKIDGAEIEPVDIVTFGSPCFPAETLVLAEGGYKPIELVEVGDKVLTHTGKWQKVLRVGGKIADTIILKGFGHPGLEVTPEHPFYASEKKRKWRNEPNRGWDSEMSLSSWELAKNMKGKFWATPIKCDALTIPPIVKAAGKGKRADIPEMNYDFWWFVGRWLGDGWLRMGDRKGRPSGWGQIFVCSAFKEADKLKNNLDSLGITWNVLQERTVTKFRTTNQALANWLLENFGQHADKKTIPMWVLSLSYKYRKAIFDGYFSADGWIRPDGSFSATTVSKQLALGMRLLAESLGYASSLYFVATEDKTNIEGREVNQKDAYTVRAKIPNKNSSRTEAHGVSWGLVRKVLPCRKSVRVYNLEVEEDNSYVVENIIVHNCQDLSVAGKREGLAGERSGLFMEAVRIIRGMRTATGGKYPRFAVWENVPGAFSSNKGQDFRAVLEEIGNAEIPMPKSGRWATAGMVRTETADIAWRVLDAQYHGVPQRRRRIFLVADFGGQRAGEILFIEEGLRGHFAESGKAREDVAGNAGDGTKGTSGNLAYSFDSLASNSMKSKNPHSGGRFVEISKTLDSTTPEPSKNQGGIAILQAREEAAATVGDGIEKSSECLMFENHGQDTRFKGPLDVAQPVTATFGMGGNNQPLVVHKSSYWDGGQISDCLTACGLSKQHMEPDKDRFHAVVLADQGGSVMSVHDDISPTLRAQEHGHQPIVMREVSRTLRAEAGAPKHEADWESLIIEPRSQDLNGGNPACNQGGMAVVCVDQGGGKSSCTVSENVAPTLACTHGGEPAVCIQGSMIGRQDKNGPQGDGINEEVSFTLNTTDRHAVAVDCRNLCENEELSATIQSKSNGGYSLNYQNPVRIGYAVRRLTPLECLRLMGFPDYWLDIEDMSDTQKYKAIGNSVAIPCVDFVMSGIARAIRPEG